MWDSSTLIAALPRDARPISLKHCKSKRTSLICLEFRTPKPAFCVSPPRRHKPSGEKTDAGHILHANLAF